MKRILGIAILSVIMACNQADQKTSFTQDSSSTDSVANKSQVLIKDPKKAEIFTQYEDLKNALVQSDSTKAQSSAAQLQTSLAAFEGCETTAKVAATIAERKNLVDQRKEFTVLSADLISLFKNTTPDQGVIYVQHCPMANKGDGGDWLSSEKEVKNPYYGTAMLECGRVTEEIKAK